MTKRELEERIAILEKQISELLDIIKLMQNNIVVYSYFPYYPLTDPWQPLQPCYYDDNTIKK